MIWKITARNRKNEVLAARRVPEYVSHRMSVVAPFTTLSRFLTDDERFDIPLSTDMPTDREAISVVNRIVGPDVRTTIHSTIE